MLLLVGLGNPNPNNSNNRHNVGFLVIDAINASTSKIIPLLLKEFSCEITTLNCKEDGDFNRGA